MAWRKLNLWHSLGLIGTSLYVILLTSVALTAPNANGATGTIVSLAHPTVANFLHIPAYAGMAGLLLISLRSLNIKDDKAILATIVVSFFHGTFMEIGQAMIPGRCASISDGLLNLVGILSILTIQLKAFPSFLDQLFPPRLQRVKSIGI